MHADTLCTLPAAAAATCACAPPRAARSRRRPGTSMYGYMAWPPNGVHSIMERKYFGCLVEVRKSTFSTFLFQQAYLPVCMFVSLSAT